MKKHILTCQHCNTEFEAKRRDAKYCSNSCKTMASIERINKANASGQEVAVRYSYEEMRKVDKEARQLNMGTEKYVKAKSLMNMEIENNFQDKVYSLERENEKLKVELAYYKKDSSKSHIVLKCNQEERNRIYNVISIHYDLNLYYLEQSIRDFILRYGRP